MSQRHWQLPTIPIRQGLPLIALGVILIAISLTGWLGYRNSQAVVVNLVTNLAREVTDRIHQHSSDYLRDTRRFLEANQASVANGSMRLADFDQLQRIFWRQAQSTDASLLYYGNEAGEFIGVGRQDGTFILHLKNAATFPERWTYRLDPQGQPAEIIVQQLYDPRQRPWYQAAVASQQATWSPIYQFTGQRILGLTPVLPIYAADGRLQGVLGIDITLSQLNEFLNSLKIGDTGEAFILERTGQVVATSAVLPHLVAPDGTLLRWTPAESTSPLIQATGQALLNEYGDFSHITATQAFSFPYDKDQLFVNMTPLQDEWGLDWLIVVVVPQSDYMTPVYAHTRQTLLLSVLVLLLAAGVSLLVVRWVTNPITAVNRAALTVEADQFDLNFLDPISQRQDEFGQLARTFQKMARQVELREQSLRQEIDTLRVVIDEVKRQQDVKQIVQTDYFRNIKEQAQEMRRQREEEEANEGET